MRGVLRACDFRWHRGLYRTGSKLSTQRSIECTKTIEFGTADTPRSGSVSTKEAKLQTPLTSTSAPGMLYHFLGSFSPHCEHDNGASDQRNQNGQLTLTLLDASLMGARCAVV